MVLRGSLQGCKCPSVSLNQGQLELLRRLFTEALYEETLSQVSVGGWVGPEAFLRCSGSGVEVRRAFRSLPLQTWTRKSGPRLTSLSLQWFTPDGFRSLFALVGTNGQGIGTRLGENVLDLLGNPSGFRWEISVGR